MPQSEKSQCKFLHQVTERAGELAKRALLEAAELRDLEDRLKTIAERTRSSDAKAGQSELLHDEKNQASEKSEEHRPGTKTQRKTNQ